MENKINNKNDILIFVDAKNVEVKKRLKKRANFNQKLLDKFKKIQFKSNFKREKSHFIIKNDFTKKTVNSSIKNILNLIM